jgi:hypothetical protein
VPTSKQRKATKNLRKRRRKEFQLLAAKAILLHPEWARQIAFPTLISPWHKAYQDTDFVLAMIGYTGRRNSKAKTRLRDYVHDALREKETG